jgi:hypothetical protein
LLRSLIGAVVSCRNSDPAATISFTVKRKENVIQVNGRGEVKQACVILCCRRAMAGVNFFSGVRYCFVVVNATVAGGFLLNVVLSWWTAHLCCMQETDSKALKGENHRRDQSLRFFRVDLVIIV